MNRRVFAALLLSAVALAPVRGQTPARVTSPVIEADRRVTFRLMAPKATEVLLSGEFMSGSKPLEKNADGLWSITVGPLEPEIYHYNFTIDGVRSIDPGNPEVKTGSTMSTLQSTLEVRGDKPAFYDGQPVPHGDVRTHWYESKSLGTLRRVTVYLPPGYDTDPAARYPVLYLFHGANADETAWIRLGRANLILDNLLAAGKTKPFIVVMPFGYGVPPGSGYGGDNTARFSRDLLEDVIPFVESRYRAKAGREDRAIVGLSMGGGQALNIGLNHVERFSHVGGFSSGLGNAADFPKTYAAPLAAPAAINAQLKLLWIGCGTEDGAMARNREFAAFLTAGGIKHTFRETPGAHTWMVWRRYLHEVAPLLFR
jgi:enterochelin esterase-like enzyme